MLSNTADSIDVVVSTGSLAPTIDGAGASQVFQINKDVQAAISGVTITGGSTAGDGGGIYNQGILTITNCTITANSASQGGGIDNTQGATLTLQGGTISQNNAAQGGGVLELGTLSADGTTFLDNQGSGGAVDASDGGQYDLDSCHFTGNSGGGQGGALLNSGGAAGSISACGFNGNAAYRGGGISVLEASTRGGAISVLSGSLTIIKSSISGNTADQGGGVFASQASTLKMDLCTISGNSAQTGGGLFNSASATLDGCAISGNSAGYDGGGIDGAADLTDCTIVGNSASVYGGGILGGRSGRAGALIACTVSGNSAGDGGGGLYDFLSYPVTLTDTIAAGNTEGYGGAPNDIAGDGGATGSYSLIGIGGSGGIVSGTNGNIVLTSLADLGLGPLANNGGPTETMALLPGSAAVHAGIAVSGVTTDQRGLPLESPPDIGAFQVQTGSPITPYTVTTTADSGGFSAAGDRKRRFERRQGYDHLLDRHGDADDRPPVASARNHCSGHHRGHDSAGLRRHSLDRAGRGRGRLRRRRSDNQCRGRDDQWAGHRRLQRVRAHPGRRRRAHPGQLHRDRSLGFRGGRQRERWHRGPHIGQHGRRYNPRLGQPHIGERPERSVHHRPRDEPERHRGQPHRHGCLRHWGPWQRG